MSTADGSSEALVAALSASLRKVSAERERLEGKLTAAQGSLQQSRRSYAALVREIRAQQDAILLTQHATREVGEEKRSIELQLSKLNETNTAKKVELASRRAKLATITAQAKDAEAALDKATEDEHATVTETQKAAEELLAAERAASLLKAKHQSVLDRVREAQAAIGQKHASIAALSNDVTHLQRQIEACERSALEQDERKIALSQDYDRVAAKCKAAAARLAELQRQHCEATAASEQARGQLASATTALRELDLTTGSLAAQLDTIRAEHARIMQQVADMTALLDERRSTHESLAAQVKEGAAAVAAAKTRVVEAETQKRDLERLVEEEQGALQAVQAEYEQEKARRSALLAAVEIASAQLHASTKTIKIAAADLAELRSVPLPKAPVASQDSVRPASARGAGGRAAEAYSRRPAKRPRVEESMTSLGSDSGDDDAPLTAVAAVAAVPVSAARSRATLAAALHSTDGEGDDVDGGATSPHTPPRASQLSLSQASAAMRQVSDGRAASAAPVTARLSGAAPVAATSGGMAPAVKGRSLFVFERYAHPAFLFHGGAAPAAKAGR